MKTLMKLRSFFYLLPNIITNIFSKPRTMNYPTEPAAVSVNFRGSVRVHSSNCVGCSLCVRDCPAFALELEGETNGRFRLIHYRDRCTYCGQCELSCRYKALYLDHAYDEPSSDRRNFIIVLVDHMAED
jgi:formate hydrogenlyase subunit 6/NADH:ubiquinone oxidoreductase subunit I